MEILKLSKFKLSVPDKVLINNTDEKACSLSVNSGDLVLIVGANGSGKTTLMKKIVGISDTVGVSLESEEILFNNKPITKGILDEIGFSPNDSDLKLVVDESITVKTYFNTVLFKDGGYKNNEDEINRLMSVFFGEKSKVYLKKKIVKCSSGEQKKMSIIGSMIRKNRKLYFFDEPMNCLDTNSMINFIKETQSLLNREPLAAIVVITHCLLFDNPSKVYKISNGKLIDDSINYKKRDCLDYLTK